MARRGRMCVVEECERKAELGSVVCKDHRETALGAEASREIALMTRRMAEMAKLDEAEEKRESAKLFRQQMARGDYALLFASKMVSMLDEAGSRNSLRREMGMLRMGMMRLMLEEEDPSRMAHALAKLTNSLGRAIQLQDQLDLTNMKISSHVRLLEEYERGRVTPEGKREPVKRLKPEPAPMEFAPIVWPPQRYSYETGELIEAEDGFEGGEG